MTTESQLTRVCAMRRSDRRGRVRMTWIVLMAVFLSVGGFGQERWKVEGRVFDNETRLPIPGVNVIVRGEKTGAMTDTTGYFSFLLNSAASKLIVFSHVAYKKSAREIRPDTSHLLGMLLYLIPDTIRFSEVVINGEKQIVPTDNAVASASYNLNGDEFERLGEDDMERALRYLLPNVIARYDQRMRFDGADFTLYVNGEFKESFYLDEIDPFNIKRVMIWQRAGVDRNIDLFPIGMPLVRGNAVVLIETKQR